MSNRPPHDTPGRRALRITLSLVVGAVLALLVLAGYFLTGERYAQHARLTFTGAELEVLQGAVTHRDDALVIRPSARNPEAVLRIPVPERLPAAQFATFSVRFAAPPANPNLFLVWLVDGAPGETVRPLTPAADDRHTLALDAGTGWEGELDTLVLVVRAASAQPIEIVRTRLEPVVPGPFDFLRRLASDWSAFEGWWGRSINRIEGGGTTVLIRPVPAAALWVVLSALVYFAWTRTTRHSLTLTPLLALFLVGWVALDLRWQSDLFRQLTLTEQQYAGKSRDEQRLAAPDGMLFEFARALKARLPETPVRVFVVAEDADGYFALRTKYHLLPHNADTRYPGRRHLRPGEIVVLLDGARRLRHARARLPAADGTPEIVDVLVAAGSDSTPIPVRPLLRTPAGQAFEVL